MNQKQKKTYIPAWATVILRLGSVYGVTGAGDLGTPIQPLEPRTTRGLSTIQVIARAKDYRFSIETDRIVLSFPASVFHFATGHSAVAF